MIARLQVARSQLQWQREGIPSSKTTPVMSISYSDFRQERTNLDDEELHMINFDDEKLRINFDDEKLRFHLSVNFPRELIAISSRLKLHAFLGC